MVSYRDVELMALLQITEELWKLRESPEAQIRVLRYVVDRLGLPVRIVKSQALARVDRCEEIEPLHIEW